MKAEHRMGKGEFNYMKDDQDLMLLAPILAFVAEQNRTIQ